MNHLQFALKEMFDNINAQHLEPYVMKDQDTTVIWEKHINYKVDKEGIPIKEYLVIKTVDCGRFTNLWIDKLYDGESMGNGFIHKSLYGYSDLYLIEFIIALAGGS